jgi:hypothetical protein
MIRHIPELPGRPAVTPAPRPSGRARLALILTLLLVPAWLAAEQARASSIVYQKTGNLYLTSPDGSRGYQLTSDGAGRLRRSPIAG